MEDKFGFQSDS